MVWQAGRDSQARLGGGDTYKEAVPATGYSPVTDNLAEQDYRFPDEKAGPGRPNVTAPPSAQMEPEDKARAAAGNPTPPGHGGGPGPGK